MPFIPVIDGDWLPQHPLTSIVGGSAAGVPLLIGTNGDEFRTFLVPSGMAGLITEDVLTTMSAAAGAGNQVISAYRAGRPPRTSTNSPGGTRRSAPDMALMSRLCSTICPRPGPSS
jgi:para-nitrobenzyl esterase